MAQAVLSSVEQMTQLAGHNRLALLMFRLGADQDFGINVFKVREVIRRPPMEQMPGLHALLAGSFDYRGQTIPVIDLAAAMAYAPLAGDPEAHVIVTEFNRTLQAFLIATVDRIVHCDGADMQTPAATLGYGDKVNAVTRIGGRLLAVVDVEQILAQLDPNPVELSNELRQVAAQQPATPRRILVVDDSAVARQRMIGILEAMNFDCVVARDGVEGLEKLRELGLGEASGGVTLIISDIEMPRMDGYALTRAIREDETLSAAPVLLHSSLSGVFNTSMVERVGADRFVAKFQPDVLARAVLDLLERDTPAQSAQDA